MADVTELRCWPACVDAIDWSQDGIIALASDERVELLFPNTVTFDRDHETSQWQHVPLKVPLFTYDELPIKDIASLSIYSIGEEISNSAPIAIAWSPPGLAKHRRCALAALTGNAVLSIWSSGGKPQEESSWSRRLIVNRALNNYFDTNTTEEPSYLVLDPIDKLRLRTRVRAFTWAPSLPDVGTKGTIGTRVSYGQHLVALANDDNQVAVVVINSPTSTLGTEPEWSARVLSHFTIMPASESIYSDAEVFEDMMRQQRYVSHIAWSPWIMQATCYRAVLAYATNGDVRARTVIYTHGSIILGEEIVYLDVETRFHGPLKWSPRVDGADEMELALFTASGLIQLTISGHDASIVKRQSHDLDRRWDQTSGACWDTSVYPTQRLHFSSLLSTLHNPTAVLEILPGTLVRLDSPSWRDQIENNLVLFGVKNDLKGNSKAKVWGLTISPLGDFIAACNSVHPSDMIEYGIPADRRGTVAISTLRQYSQIRQAFPSRNASAESILFTIKKLAENTVEDANHIPEFAGEMVQKLLEAYPPHEGTGTSTAHSGSSDLEILIEALKNVVFFDSSTLKDRYATLVAQACNTTVPDNLSRTLIAYNLAKATQKLPSALSRMSFSAEILQQHQQLISLVHVVIGADKMDAQSRLPSDTCDFCSAPIPFADLASAACTNGHQFPRCGLSFVAIQAPGVTKYCGICSTPYLSDEFAAAQEAMAVTEVISTEVGVDDDPQGKAQDQDREANMERTANETNVDPAEVPLQQERTQEQPDGSYCEQGSIDRLKGSHTAAGPPELPITLARVLFGACDACIYCGGKFVD